MERFNYPDIQSALDENAEILYLLECEQYGYKADEKEQWDEVHARIDALENQMGG